MTLPPFPKHQSLVYTWWKYARRAPIDELAAWITSDDFDRLSLANQRRMVDIYDQAKGNTNSWNPWATAAGAAGLGCLLSIGLASILKGLPRCTVDPVICAQQGVR